MVKNSIRPGKYRIDKVGDYLGLDYKGIALIPIVTILVDIFKKAGLPCKFAPIVSLIIGLAFGLLFQNDGDVREGILKGLVIGMSASGLYSHGREITKQIRNSNNKE